MVVCTFTFESQQMKFKIILTGAGAIQQRRFMSRSQVKSIKIWSLNMYTLSMTSSILDRNERRRYVVKCCGSASCINPIVKTRNGTAKSISSKGMQTSKQLKENSSLAAFKKKQRAFKHTIYSYQHKAKESTCWERKNGELNLSPQLLLAVLYK